MFEFLPGLVQPKDQYLLDLYFIYLGGKTKQTRNGVGGIAEYMLRITCYPVNELKSGHFFLIKKL